MSLIELSADMHELYEIRVALTRIAEALERLSPPLPDLTVSDEAVRQAEQRYRDNGSRNEFTFAESPEQYQERQSHDAALAASLGVAPWSPAFQTAIAEMRNELMETKLILDEEGRQVEVPARTEEEADQIVRDAFNLAKAQANRRT